MTQTNNRDKSALVAARYLKSELTKRHMTQEQFAEILYVDPRTVRRWIHNGISSLNVVDEIASRLGVSVRDVLTSGEDIPFYVLF